MIDSLELPALPEKRMRTTQLTTKQVARLFNVSEATVKRWADNGVLKRRAQH